jgi:hypothetical protein
MIWYLKQINNPDKHDLMPDDFPWQVSHVAIEGWDTFEGELSELEFSFEIAAYLESERQRQNLERQTTQREYGEVKIKELIDKMGERNLQLSQDGVAVNIGALATDNLGLKVLVETGALTTACGLAGQLKSKYPTHSDIYEDMVEEVMNWLTAMGYV